MQVGSGDLNIVAEDIVVGDLEGLDCRLFLLLALHGCNPAPAVPEERSQPIYLRIVAFFDHPSFPQMGGWIVNDGAL